MENCCTSTRGTTLLSRVVLPAQPGAVVRPQAAPTTRFAVPAMAGATPRRGRALTWDVAVQPSAASAQGGAVATTGAAPVTDLRVTDPSVVDLMVIDHPYSTRLGPLSCRPPV